MAKENLKEQEKLHQEKVEEGLSAVETFFNENKKIIWGSIAAIIAAGAIVLSYQKFYVQPKRVEGQAQMFPAEANFRAQEYNLALNGDGNVLGFAQIAEEYGAKAGKSVYLYAGICELKLGNYENALSYLKKYNGKDEILAAKALAYQGEAYTGLEKYKEALVAFEKAASKADNIFAASYLLKAGNLCEEIGDKAKALSFYKKVKDQYPQSMEAYDVDKYISRIENAPAE